MLLLARRRLVPVNSVSTDTVRTRRRFISAALVCFAVAAAISDSTTRVRAEATVGNSTVPGERTKAAVECFGPGADVENFPDYPDRTPKEVQGRGLLKCEGRGHIVVRLRICLKHQLDDGGAITNVDCKRKRKSIDLDGLRAFSVRVSERCEPPRRRQRFRSKVWADVERPGRDYHQSHATGHSERAVRC